MCTPGKCSVRQQERSLGPICAFIFAPRSQKMRTSLPRLARGEHARSVWKPAEHALWHPRLNRGSYQNPPPNIIPPCSPCKPCAAPATQLHRSSAWCGFWRVERLTACT